MLIITARIDLKVLKMNVVTAGSGDNDFENCLFPLVISNIMAD